MKRIYESGTRDSVTLFIGTEVEHTPMYGEKTLFVVGTQDVEDIARIAFKNGIKHIYCGANQSFELSGDGGTYNENADWENMIQGLLKLKLWVTLDFDIKYVEWVAECCFSETNRFIPII